MSRENLESLLDSMLEESATAMEAAVTREREEKERREREEKASVLRARAKEAPAAVFDDVAALGGLADGELRKVLAKAAPDDLIVVLATSEDEVQRRILANLSADSVSWVRENLAHIDRVTNAERESAHRGVLKVANALLAAGEIELPAPKSEAEDGGDPLRALLTDLVRLGATAGPAALRDALASAGEPLLERGLELVTHGVSGSELVKALAEQKAALAAEHARRLSLMEEAVLAIAEGEPAERFEKRVFG